MKRYRVRQTAEILVETEVRAHHAEHAHRLAQERIQRILEAGPQSQAISVGGIEFINRDWDYVQELDRHE